MLMPSRPPPRLSARGLMTECPILLPQTMRPRSAVHLLDAAGLDAAPVVDTAGRCVGVFTAGDYLRALAVRLGDETAPAAGRTPPDSPDWVRSHMARGFAAAGLDADADELHYRLRGAAGAFVVILDRQRRPRGVVCGLDIPAHGSAAAEGRPR